MRGFGDLEAVVMDRVWAHAAPVTVRDLFDELGLVLGEPVTAQKAVSWGIANRSLPPAELHAAARAAALAIAGRAPAKIVWKTPITTRRKIMGPTKGCRKIESRRRVQIGGAGGR